MLEDSLTKVLEELFDQEDYKHCFLVDIEVKPKSKVEVYIDADDGLTLGVCQKISRYLEGFIDENNWLGEKYILEVSSPGIERPLKFLRQYKKNIGRTLKVSLNEGKNVEGKLTQVTDVNIVLQDKNSSQEIALNNITKAQVIVSFK